MVCEGLFFFKQKTAYEMRISDWSSDVCSSDLDRLRHAERAQLLDERHGVWRATVRCDAQLHHSRCGVLDQPRKPFQELPVRRCDALSEVADQSCEGARSLGCGRAGLGSPIAAMA